MLMREGETAIGVIPPHLGFGEEGDKENEIPSQAYLTYTVQLIGPSGKLDAFIRAIGDMPILEVVRSGVSGVGRGERVLSA